MSLVYATAWLAVACWYVGFWRFLQQVDPLALQHDRGFNLAWRSGAVGLLIHIALSYGWVHAWDHQKALAATAAQSQAVMGIAAGWGVYVNLVFATLWLLDAYVVKLHHRVRRAMRVTFMLFSLLMMFSATVIFGSWLGRLIASIAFAALAVRYLLARFISVEDASAEERLMNSDQNKSSAG